MAKQSEHINVYHTEEQDGITTQKIAIHYPFVVPDRMDITALDILMETGK